MNMSNLSARFQDLYDRYGNYLLAILIAGSASWFGYKYYRNWSEQKSFTQFAESIDDYNKLALRDGKSSEWQDIQTGLSARAQSNSGSSLAPYFSALQADAQIKEGNIDGALATYDKLLAKLPKNSPLYPLYVIKQALIKTDATQESVRVDGMKILELIALDPKSPVQDMALYYLGYFAWAANDLTTAEKYFDILIKNSQDSVWAKMAMAKLEVTK